MAWMPGVARPGPAGVAAFQVIPSREVQTTTSLSPAVAPNVPVTVKPPPAAATALTCAVPAGTGRAAAVQVRPPSAERAAYGTGPAAVRATPAATTVRPAAATCCKRRRGGPGRERQVGQAPGPAVRRGPRGGTPPCEPTATKPPAAAVTASICRSPPCRDATRTPRRPARPHPSRRTGRPVPAGQPGRPPRGGDGAGLPARSGHLLGADDHVAVPAGGGLHGDQAAAGEGGLGVGGGPGPAVRRRRSPPDAPGRVTASPRPRRLSRRRPAVPPTASQPAGPCATLVSCWIPGLVSTPGSARPRGASCGRRRRTSRPPGSRSRCRPPPAGGPGPPWPRPRPRPPAAVPRPGWRTG